MNLPERVYLFSYFKGHGDGLHLAWSADGFRWAPLGDDQPFIKGEAGPEKLMRDPFVFPARDGSFHLVWTAGWRGKGIGYSSSLDLLHWTPQRFIGVMEHERDALNCWAPEIFFDEDHAQYILYWATSIPGRFPQTDDTGDEGLNHRMYYTRTRDFKTFDETRLFFDAGFNVIDATLVKDGARYLLFVKDETRSPCQKNIRVAISDDLYSGFGHVSKPLTGAYWAEGPTAIRMDDAWIVYFDKYKLGQMGAVMSRDLVHWQEISSLVHFPPGAQHGSVVKIWLEQIRHLF